MGNRLLVEIPRLLNVFSSLMSRLDCRFGWLWQYDTNMTYWARIISLTFCYGCSQSKQNMHETSGVQSGVNLQLKSSTWFDWDNMYVLNPQRKDHKEVRLLHQCYFVDRMSSDLYYWFWHSFETCFLKWKSDTVS